MVIQMKRKHVIHGDDGCRSCPAALAIAEHLASEYKDYSPDISVDEDEIRLGAFHAPEVFPTPQNLRKWILQFDATAGGNHRMEPIDFEIPDSVGENREWMKML